jgi:hypothetical protein
LREVTGLDLTVMDAPKPITTLNEWMLYKLGRPANGGDIVRDAKVTALVRKVRRNLVQEAQVTVEREPESEKQRSS